MPTLDEIENVWAIPEVPEEPGEDETDSEEAKVARDEAKLAQDRAVKVLVWWVDQFLPYAVGLEFWGPTIHPFRLMTDLEYVSGDPSGNMKVLVTITSEAFAHLIFANCRDKWQADYDYFKANKNAKRVPAYNKEKPETHKHVNKWSSSRTGQVLGGGWSKEGIKYFLEKQKEVKAFRELEASRGNNLHKETQKLICKANDIMLENEADSATTKKRKATG